MKRFRKRIDEPSMSDRTILVSVEDLIYQAFGINKNNRVNFKLMQAILHILARQLHMLEQDVEIKVDDIIDLAEDASYDDESTRYSSTSIEGDGLTDDYKRKRPGRERAGKADTKKRGEKGEKEEPKGRRGKGEKEDGEISSKDRERKGRSKDRDEKDKRSRGRDKSSKDREKKDERSRERDKSSRRKRGEDDVNEGGRERGRDRERGEERGADGRGGREGEREADGRGGRGGEREADGRGGRGGERDADGRGGRGGEHEADGRGGRGGERDADGRGGRGGEREADGRGGRGGERDADGRGGRGGEHEADGRGGRGGEREADGRGGRGGEREADGRGGRGGERGTDGRGGRGGEREDRDAQRQDRGGRDFGRQTSGTSITGGRPARIGSIEVVTASQFALLGKAVKQLEQITGPLPEPVLPDNETLRHDLAKGRASLQDTMQAMQLNARLQAAQNGLYRMAEMLTQLAQLGMVPPQFAGHVGAMEEYLRVAKAAGYAPPAPGSPGGPDGPDGPGSPAGPSPAGRRGRRGKPGKGPGAGRDGTGGTVSTMSSLDENKSIATVAEDAPEPGKPKVTFNDMHETLKRMKEAICKEINKLTSTANHSADIACNISRSVAEKLDSAMQVNDRINILVQQTEDYAEQLRGFDSGIMTQVNNFQDQLVVMRNELSESLALLEASINNTETTVLVDLKERHHGLVVMMENTVRLHEHLHVTQVQISDELRSLVQCVETLREQKADRDEVLDGLKDKANLSRLAGLLYEKDFAHARSEIEQRISKCYEMFGRQDMKWREALVELTAISDTKAELSTLREMKDATVAELDAIQRLLYKLEIMLGEPKAAILMRKLGKDGSCGERLSGALVGPPAAPHEPPAPPAHRPPPLGAEQDEPCLGQVNLALPDTNRTGREDRPDHRWAGGSYTVMVDNVVKEQAEPMQLQIIPTKKFEAYGSDGKLYMMEEGMLSCAECNKERPWCACPHVGAEGCPCSPSGAGDHASGPPVL